LEYFIELVFAAGLFINAILFIPQAMGIYKTKDSHGQSLLTFAGFNVIQLFTILHAYIHEDRILLLGYLLSLVTCGAVTFLIVLYRSK
jgi:MtN3 and saliva related transmembrane protein